ncbi:SDR family NAD(P)-dependent oxidoreductase [Ktedonosporobacter rubrisoli]|uniref:SDR family NAD(P)-dependent oxidoreductase n=1 Tax=Ktedonosporobacter rubrisoli TaxID=2509675 RepID=A0A4P6JHJ2_KTERU|nr:SDR family NAD(P)-dependent oxidoreductase [Ktedonosporobacter rubrisoli]QBD74489.1 SDR family NAD(P)-dependent oxidoreductase [Ktedonosporobacter rubrisoli]
MQTIVIVGAGPGLGFSVARQFGHRGFRIALIARTQATLEALVQRLEAKHDIEATSFPADIKDLAQLHAAFTQIRRTYGHIDVMYFNRGPSEPKEIASVLDLTHENVYEQLQNHVYGAMSSVQEVLPAMLDKGHGTLLFTTGVSSIVPIPTLANVGIAMAGLRNYAHCLHTALASKGIYVGHLIIATGLRPRIASGEDPDIPASLLYDMWQKRDRQEEKFAGYD